MTSFMLDTNICSHVIRRRPEAVRDRLRDAIARGGTIVISAVTYYEMRRGGAAKGASPRLGAEIDAFVARLHAILPFGAEAADQAALLHAKLRGEGRLIGANDLLVAGHALVADCALVTNNTREFRRIPGLRIEDWAGSPGA